MQGNSGPLKTGRLIQLRNEQLQLDKKYRKLRHVQKQITDKRTTRRTYKHGT